MLRCHRRTVARGLSVTMFADCSFDPSSFDWGAAYRRTIMCLEVLASLFRLACSKKPFVPYHSLGAIITLHVFEGKDGKGC